MDHLEKAKECVDEFVYNAAIAHALIAIAEALEAANERERPLYETTPEGFTKKDLGW
jgi:hypothetical protein